MIEPLVFLPGMMCDARVFGPQLTAFSPMRAVTAAPITQGDRVEEIASNLLDVLPPRFALAGLALGGIVAMEVLRRAPDRVSRIALMNANPLAETPQSSADLEPLIIKARAGNLDQLAPGVLRPEWLAPGPGRAEVMALVRDMAGHLGAPAIVRQLRAMQRRRDYQAILRRCKTPALVLCGDHDGLTPIKRNKFMADLIPYAELAVIEGAGHLPTLERPEETTQALMEWIKQPLVLQ
ncbi:alpha/beta fold hydrolase [Roseovarius spongiae]|uniref:Alpha/beta fold hydrolase n=1 Tax=Roseovarius spongiae TaxID=2320272 RepID=A0A3A8AXI2_9RHOB|nr:alpha/beta hydrolase [Roseovarius spongiae]RKF16456.1 alpha/beta fold hydrolase [Roseovarius spongiae]